MTILKKNLPFAMIGEQVHWIINGEKITILPTDMGGEEYTILLKNRNEWLEEVKPENDAIDWETRYRELVQKFRLGELPTEITDDLVRNYKFIAEMLFNNDKLFMKILNAWENESFTGLYAIRATRLIEHLKERKEK